MIPIIGSKKRVFYVEISQEAIMSFCVALSCGRALLEYNIYMIIIEVDWGATKPRGIDDVNGI